MVRSLKCICSVSDIFEAVAFDASDSHANRIEIVITFPILLPPEVKNRFVGTCDAKPGILVRIIRRLVRDVELVC